MANIDARLVPTPPPRGDPFGVGGQARRIGKWAGRRLLGPAMFAGDLVSGALAIAAAAAIVTAAAGEVGVASRMQAQAGLLLLLLLGINCALGLYRSNLRNPMELFRLRMAATMLFVFAGALMWIRTGPSVELAIVPLAGMLASVLGSWV